MNLQILDPLLILVLLLNFAILATASLRIIIFTVAAQGFVLAALYPIAHGNVHEADAAGGVPKRDQVLAEQPHPHGRAVGLRQLPAQEGGHPVATHRRAHRGAGADARQELVVLV